MSSRISTGVGEHPCFLTFYNLYACPYQLKVLILLILIYLAFLQQVLIVSKE